ncbi:ArsR/SmtB family transcription factor [Paenibacillus sp. SAF-054]|uniref:ArsR/SmtB family transcription factor n=1 Tax=unclassified Paenibacillus TaxID=185978 RepID=UPI003F80B98E
MQLLDMSFKGNSFQVEGQSSLLFESALGIAAMTHKKLHDALDKPDAYWKQLWENVSGSLRRELIYCEEHQTWKMLLQLLHMQAFASVAALESYVERLENEDFKFIVLPYLGRTLQPTRRLAAEGDADAAAKLIAACASHEFFPEMIRTVSQSEAEGLKRHLLSLLKLWDVEVAAAEAETKSAILKRDLARIETWTKTCSPEEVVLRAAGVEYQAEAGVSRVLLIPHVIYRPWTIEANMEGVQIFYYPVSNESLSADNDPYQPPGRLVQLYKALGDEKRLRALKLIAEKERSLKELTDLLGLGKTTVHHHLAILRGAGLVRVKEGSYSWNTHSLNHQDCDLRSFLGLEPTDS